MIDPKLELIERRGEKTWRELGTELDISHSYLWQVAKGSLPASEKLLEKLGLRIVYERIELTKPARKPRSANGGSDRL